MTRKISSIVTCTALSLITASNAAAQSIGDGDLFGTKGVEKLPPVTAGGYVDGVFGALSELIFALLALV